MTQALLSELLRVKALFQARTLSMHLGVKPPEKLGEQNELLKSITSEGK